ncbi:MAG: amylo-alpha-1,6-glucosidase [Candidatus Aminicenantes bacterium]|nr:amylo-alpha-1,6-glucosidase [Candidatus Aminicenantes bacterium]
MKKPFYNPVEEAKKAALEILIHNSRGPYQGLPRTAGWGYPEPYTRDLMVSALGILASENEQLINCLKKVLETLAQNQTFHGHIPSLVHDPEDRGASDTTPLFLMSLAIFRRVTGNKDFLEEAANKALTWMEYQSPSDRVMVAQLPTSDWRDEQWVLGYGLYVNTIVFAYLCLFGRNDQAEQLRDMIRHFIILGEKQSRHVHEGLVVPHKPYYSLWSYKIYRNERFDLLGNSLAILTGIASHTRSKQLISWIESECKNLREHRELAVDLPPNLFPYIRPEDPDWRPRYETYNKPGEYHNGGVWPFICGFYVAAVLAAGMPKLAEKKLVALTELVRPARGNKLSFGFNEWIRAKDGTPQGQDWQTWSAAMYLYAAKCVEKGQILYFDKKNR